MNFEPLKSFLKVVVPLGLFVAFCIVPSLPMFLANHQRSKQSECRRGLSAVMTRFGELQDGGVVTLSVLAEAVPPDRWQPYTYVLGPGMTVRPIKDQPDDTERYRQMAKVQELVEPGLRGTCPSCELTIACVGNTDGDDELDLISVSSTKRYVFGHLPVAAGEQYKQSTDFPHDSEKAVRFEPADGG